MTKDDYVSLEVAKKLKEKGFNEICPACYRNEKFMGIVSWNEADMFEGDFYSAPTLYEAQKWLRTSKNIHVNADYEVYREKWFFSLCLINPDKFNQFEDMSESNYNSYEEALNAGILESLNYI